jgi:hypothetical protein
MSAGSKDAVPSSICSSDSDGGLIFGPITSELAGMADGRTLWWAGMGAGSRMSRLDIAYPDRMR